MLLGDLLPGKCRGQAEHASWQSPDGEMEQAAGETAGIWGSYLQLQGRGLPLQLSVLCTGDTNQVTHFEMPSCRLLMSFTCELG